RDTRTHTRGAMLPEAVRCPSGHGASPGLSSPGLLPASSPLQHILTFRLGQIVLPDSLPHPCTFNRTQINPKQHPCLLNQHSPRKPCLVTRTRIPRDFAFLLIREANRPLIDLFHNVTTRSSAEPDGNRRQPFP